MSHIFMTGGTGYLGSYVLDVILRHYPDVELTLLTRATSRSQGIQKLWRSLQLHMDEEEFWAFLPRIHFAFGDLTHQSLIFDPKERDQVLQSCDSILHIAASLNRKSAKACLNHNLRGCLYTIHLARDMAKYGKILRLSHVSTVAVAGHRDRELVFEDQAIDWNRSDYDPYGRTKKFCEHMFRQLLPDIPLTFFRPSIVMGDSRHEKTTQFDMVRAFCILADLPILPFRGDTRLDIVNADFVGQAIAHLHLKPKPNHQIYHLSSGLESKTAREISAALLQFQKRKPPIFVPQLQNAFEFVFQQGAQSRRRNTLTYIASLFKVFWPYITYDTVFDHQRVVRELGLKPTPFVHYCGPLYEFAKSHHYQYPYRPLSRKV